MPDIFVQVRMACELEARAIKAGNVHPRASFHDMTYDDFCESAKVLETTWRVMQTHSLGNWILAAVNATQQAVGKNSNLGIILLLAPLAKAALLARSEIATHRLQTHQVLSELSGQDCSDVFQAIRIARPGGLGVVEQHDVRSSASTDLLAAMQLAASYDDVALQYVTNFSEVFRLAARLQTYTVAGKSILESIAGAQLEYLSAKPDSLIARKCGTAVAEKIRQQAANVFQCYVAESPAFEAQWTALDQYLRSDNNRLNPGTTADLLAAATFIYLFQNQKTYGCDTISR